MGYRIQNRRDTAARWAEMNPILLEGEIGLVTDNANQYKVGDGIHAWNDLPLRGFTGTISQELGEDENAVVSQKVVTEKFVESDGKLAELGSKTSIITREKRAVNVSIREERANIQYPIGNVSRSETSSHAISNIINLYKGEKISVELYCAVDVAAISVYEEEHTPYPHIPKVEGVGTSKQTYEYIADEDCIIVLCGQFISSKFPASCVISREAYIKKYDDAINNADKEIKEIKETVNDLAKIANNFSTKSISGVVPNDGTFDNTSYNKLQKNLQGEYALATETFVTTSTKIFYRPSVERRNNKAYSIAAAVFVGNDADKIVATGTWSATNAAWIYNVDINTNNKNIQDTGVVELGNNEYLAFQVEAVDEAQATLATTAYLRIPSGLTLNIGIKKILVLDVDNWDKESMLPILIRSAQNDANIWANGDVAMQSLSDDIAKGIISEAVEETKKELTKNDPINIVVCGNSFSANGFRYVGRVAKYLGKKVDVWMVGRSGASFERNIEAFDSNLIPQVLYHYNAETDTIEEYGNGGSNNTLGYSYKDVLALNKWDYLFVHQGSARSAANFDVHFGGSNDYMRKWIKRLRTNIGNSNVKVGIQMTWPYHQDYSFAAQGMAEYGAPDANTMYANIIDNILKAKKLYDFDIVIPNGTAMKNAEFTTEYRSNNLIVHNTVDDVHISSIGMFACALVFCCKFFDVNIDDINVADITTEQGSISNRLENKLFAQKIAKSALRWEWGETNVEPI